MVATIYPHRRPAEWAAPHKETFLTREDAPVAACPPKAGARPRILLEALILISENRLLTRKIPYLSHGSCQDEPAWAGTGPLRLVERYTETEGILAPADLDELVPDWCEREAWACGPIGLLDAIRPWYR
jgi:hypothetical protein